MSQKFVVLDINGYAKQLVDFSASHFAKPYDLESNFDPEQRKHVVEILQETPLVPFTQKRAYAYISVLVTEVLESKLAYVRPHNRLETYACLLFNITDVLLTKWHLMIAEQFQCESVPESVFIEVARQIGTHVESNCWTEWQVHCHTNLVAMSSGRDYRVVEWELMTGNATDEPSDLKISLANMATFITAQLVDALGPVGQQVPIHPIIQDAISRTFPQLKFDRTAMINFDHMASVGIANYEVFYEQFISRVIDAFAVTNLYGRLSRDRKYTGTLTPTFVLEIDEFEDCAMRPAKSELENLVDAYVRGDWLPPRERRLAEEHYLAMNV
jgi:hypothetical protein